MDAMNFRCPACLEEFAEGTTCPHCGFDGKKTDQPPFLKIGTVLQTRYRVGRSVHSNGEGVTYLAFDREKNARVYIREFFPQEVTYRMEDGVSVSVLSGGEEAYLAGKKQFQVLFERLKTLDNLAIMNTYHVFSENNTVYAVMQHCAGGTLRRLIERKETPLSWNQARRLFQPIIDTLITLRKEEIGHYGISPDNLYIFPDGSMRLGGFGIDTIRQEEQDFASELFSGCAALEQYVPNTLLSEATDVYALSACLLYSMTGTLPQDADRRKYDQRLLLPNAVLEAIPPFVVTALAGGLQVYADKRTATFEELKKALYVEPQAAVAVAPPAKTEAEAPRTVQKRKKASEEPEKKYYARVPDFLAGAIAFLVSVIILSNVVITYVKNDPEYPYIQLDLSMFTSSVGASTSSSATSSNVSSVPPTSSQETSSQQTVSIPEGAVEIPNYAGRTYEDLKKETAFRILLAGKEFNEDYEEGEVIRQNVTGYALPGSSIAVVISRGSKMRKMPDVTGLPLQEAQAKLMVAGFVPGAVTEERNDGLPDGTVIRFHDDTLEVGEKYEYGTVVELVVSYSEEVAEDTAADAQTEE